MRVKRAISLRYWWLFAAVVCCVPGCFGAGSEVDTQDTGAVSADAADETAPPSDAGADATGDGCEQGATVCGEQCVDLASSLQHCGACQSPCVAEGSHSVAQCIDAVCVRECEEGFVDADKDPANGCEFECTPTNDGVEICDGADNDCNGVVDEDDAEGAPVWFLDSDEDGFGDAAVEALACDKPEGYVDNDTDCDDADADVHTEMQAIADQDGDGFTEGSAQTLCTDGTLPEGYVGEPNDGDCDDTNDQVHPSAEEVCGDGVDNDCDHQIDDASAVDAKIWFVDCDADGFAANTTGARTRCEAPTMPPNGCSASDATWTDTHPSGGNTTDCNDDLADAFPGQTAWFDTPIRPGGWQTADWDYNCDGQMNHRWTNQNASCEPESQGLACSGTAGWVGNYTMACGSSAQFQECSLQRVCNPPGPCIYLCDDSVVTRTQECR